MHMLIKGYGFNGNASKRNEVIFKGSIGSCNILSFSVICEILNKERDLIV